MQNNLPKLPQLKTDEPKMALTTSDDFKINYMQRIRKQRKKRAIVEGG